MFKKIIVTIIVLVSFVFMAFTKFTEFNETPNSDTSEITEEGTYDPIIVLELYTSQGCSSCPPADKLLDKVKNEYKDNVFALSYHVDYWDYIGWKDPFGNAAYSKKQNSYNVKFNSRSNYTPQIVVNGQEHFVGSSTSKMYAKIDAYQSIKTTNKVIISNIKPSNERITFDYTVAGSIENKKIRAVLVLDQRTTEVKRGENRNRNLTNSNIVVAENILDIDSSSASASIDIPKKVNGDEKIQLMLFVENDNYDITGAAKNRVNR